MYVHVSQKLRHDTVVSWRHFFHAFALRTEPKTGK